MKRYTKVLIALVLLGVVSCAPGGYRDDEKRLRSYQYSPYSSYPSDYWGNRPDYGVPLPGHRPSQP
jgi:hypothetical protein